MKNRRIRRQSLGVGADFGGGEHTAAARKNEKYGMALEQKKLLCLYLVDLCEKDTTTPSGRPNLPDVIHRCTATTKKKKRFQRFPNASAERSVPSSLRRHVSAVHFHDWTVWLKYSLKWDGGGGGMGATTARRENNTESERDDDADCFRSGRSGFPVAVD